MVHRRKESKESFVLERIISFFEKERLNLLGVFLWILLVSIIRMVLESHLFSYQRSFPDIIFWYAHTVSFFLTVFIGGVLILKFVTKERIGKIANLASLGFTVVIFPPLFDFFIFHRSNSYFYILRENFLDAATSFFYKIGSFYESGPNVGGPGLLIELTGIMVATSLYVYIKTKSLHKAIINFFIFYLFILLIVTPALNPLIYQFQAGSSVAIQPLLFLHYFVLSLIFLVILLKISKGRLLSSFIKSARLLTTLHALAMVLLGVLIAGFICYNPLNITDLSNVDIINYTDANVTSLLNVIDTTRFKLFTSAGNIGMLGISLFTILFLWQYAVMINHVYDIDIDKKTNKDRILVRGMLTIYQVKKMAIIFAIIAVGLAFLLGIHIVILVFISLFLGTIYSIPPLRLRNKIFSTIFIGLGSTIAFLIGYYTPSYIPTNHALVFSFRQTQSIINVEMQCEMVKNIPVMTIDVIGIGLLIFIALSIGPIIKDLKDYESDKIAGVKNIFTVYGKEKGINIAAMLLFITFISPLILFRGIYDILIFIPTGIISAIIFKKFEEVQPIFLLYFLVLLYCVTRWFNIL